MYAFMITLIYFGSAQKVFYWENDIKNDNKEDKICMTHEPLQSHWYNDYRSDLSPISFILVSLNFFCMCVFFQICAADKK